VLRLTVPLAYCPLAKDEGHFRGFVRHVTLLTGSDWVETMSRSSATPVRLPATLNPDGSLRYPRV